MTLLVVDHTAVPPAEPTSSIVTAFLYQVTDLVLSWWAPHLAH